ncbi:hypothetical protein FQJ93_22935, partial [Xanthomonas vasicola]
ALLVLAVHTGAHEALLTALSPFVLTAPSIHYAKWAVLTLLCALVVYQWLSLHRKRTGQCS